MLATGSLMRMYKNRAVMAWRQGFSYIKWIKNIKFCNILAKKNLNIRTWDQIGLKKKKISRGIILTQMLRLKFASVKLSIGGRRNLAQKF